MTEVIEEKIDNAIEEASENVASIENQEEISSTVASNDLTKEDHALISIAANTLGRIGLRFGFGGFLGFCAGYTIKKAAKVTAVIVGFGFISLQSLQYCGYIEVKWGKIKQDLVKSIDSDGSGKVGVKDIKFHLTRMMNVLRFHGMPLLGFSSGLYTGFLEG